MKDKSLTFLETLEAACLEYAKKSSEEIKRVDVNEALVSNAVWSVGADGKLSLLGAKIQECEAPKPFAGLALGEAATLSADDDKRIHDMAAEAFLRVDASFSGEEGKWREAYRIAHLRVALAKNEDGVTLANGWSINITGTGVRVKPPVGSGVHLRSESNDK